MMTSEEMQRRFEKLVVLLNEEQLKEFNAWAEKVVEEHKAKELSS